MSVRRLLPPLFLAAVAGVGWQRRGLLRSLCARRLAAALPNPAKRRGLDIRIPADRGKWIKLTLKVDLGPTLSEVVGYPLEAAAYSHFGGFNLSHVYSDFVNPDSAYYQAWIGAYVVFDGDHVRHFGFDDAGRVLQQSALDVLEADQRLVLGGTGCPHRFPDGRRVRLIGDLMVTAPDGDGEGWWKLEGKAETWSAYHRGSSSGGNSRSEAGYGRVPVDAPHPVDDFHPLTYSGSFWMRYFPEWKATCAKFYIIPEYTDRSGRVVTKGRQLGPECQAIVGGITFARGRRQASS